MLPTAAVTTNCEIVFPAGSYIDLDILRKECDENGVDKDRIHIDRNAFIMRAEDADTEEGSSLRDSIASTCSGTGAAVMRRISRSQYSNAGHDTRTVRRACNATVFLHDILSKDRCVILEGTQGYELSVLHARNYPYATARDTSAAGILSESGLSIRDVDKVCTVFRTYPIRVGGNSGPLPYECSWDDVTKWSGASVKLKEFTTVTNRPRRVAKFDFASAAAVVAAEKPDIIVINHMDYIDYFNINQDILSKAQAQFITEVEEHMERFVNMVGNGPDKVIELL